MVELRERDEAIERWLCEDVAKTYDAMKAGPGRGIPASEAFAALKAKHLRS